MHFFLLGLRSGLFQKVPDYLVVCKVQSSDPKFRRNKFRKSLHGDAVCRAGRSWVRIPGQVLSAQSFHVDRYQLPL